MKRIVVIGGGISGMSAAQAAWELGGTIPGGLEVLVLERDREVGGKARSLREGEWLFEGGPSSVPGNEVAFDRMVRAAKLESQCVQSAPDAARRFVVRGGKLRELAPSPLGLVKNGVLSPLGALRLAGERFVAGRKDARDESVLDFARRRIGNEAAERLARPLVNGVWAGDPAKLSLPAAFPRLLEFETRFGGLIKGVREIARMPQREREEAGTLTGPSQHTTLRDGLQSLPRALAAQGHFPVRCGTSARAVVRAPKEKGGWYVHVDGGEPLHADAVVLAGEAWANAELVREAVPELATELAAISHPPLAVVGLGLGPDGARAVPRGFGALVGGGEPVSLLGCMWDSAIFAGRAPRDHALVRCMYGGAVAPQTALRSDDELVAAARADLRTLLGIEAAPAFTRVARWERSIPQYELGHRERRARIENAVERSFGLYLCGNATQGVAFARAGFAGVLAGEKAARGLAQR